MISKTSILFFALLCPMISFAEQMPRLVSVNGEASVKVVPDEVAVTLGVESFDLNLAKAKSMNDEAVRRVLALAKKYDIDPKYVKTDYISVEPRYNDQYGKHTLVGYNVQKNIVVVLKDVKKFEGFLSDAIEGGANYVLGVNFQTTELRKYRDQARIEAVKAAREKAAAMALALGQRIGKASSIQEIQSDWHVMGMRKASFRNMAMDAAAPSEAGGEGTVSPGQIDVVSRVAISFELE